MPIPERVFIVDLPIRAEVVVDKLRIRDRLLRNFYALIYGAFTHTNPTMIDDGGNTFTANVSGDITGGEKCRVVLCSEESELPFNAHTCTKISTLSDVVMNSYAEGANSVIEAIAFPDNDAKSILFQHQIQDPALSGHWVAYGHIANAIESIYTIKYRIIFALPFVKNIARILHAVFMDSDDVTAKDINGSEFYVHGTKTLFSGPAQILLGQGSTSPTPDDYTLSNPVSIPTHTVAIINDQFAEILVKGVYVPNTTTTVSEIGLALTIKDVGGNDHLTLIARYIFSTAPTLQANRAYVFGFRIYGS